MDRVASICVDVILNLFTRRLAISPKCISSASCAKSTRFNLEFNNRNQLAVRLFGRRHSKQQNKRKKTDSERRSLLLWSLSLCVLSCRFFLSVTSLIAFDTMRHCHSNRLHRASVPYTKIYFVSNFIIKEKNEHLIKLANHTDASSAVNEIKLIRIHSFPLKSKARRSKI